MEPVCRPESPSGRRMLAGIDVLVFDIQDVGTRFYTYMCTMKNAMEEAANANIDSSCSTGRIRSTACRSKVRCSTRR